MINKKGFEFGFGWLFAIIVGAVIIFLAIYTVVKLIPQEQDIQSSQSVKELENLLSPIENVIEKGKISFAKETRLTNTCETAGNFGSQRISLSSRTSIGKAWTSEGISSRSYNKYIFSSEKVEGKEMHLFTKPFSFPFRIGNLIFLWGDKEKYCFVNAPREMEEEISDLGLKNINVTSRIADCEEGSKSVCFASTRCDIDVDLMAGKVSKKGEKAVYYEDSIVFSSTSNVGRKDYSLLYGAIFADPEIYECQVKRLGKRASELALIYFAKSGNIAANEGCSANIQGELSNFAETMRAINSSASLKGIRVNAEELGRKNNDLICKIF